MTKGKSQPLTYHTGPSVAPPDLAGEAVLGAITANMATQIEEQSSQPPGLSALEAVMQAIAPCQTVLTA